MKTNNQYRKRKTIVTRSHVNYDTFAIDL